MYAVLEIIKLKSSSKFERIDSVWPNLNNILISLFPHGH